MESGLPGWAVLKRGLRVDQQFVGEAVYLTFTLRFERLQGKPKYIQKLIVNFHNLEEITTYVYPYEMEKKIHYKLRNPRYWYPVGSKKYRYPASLYKLSIKLSSEPIFEKRIGIRKVSMDDRIRYIISINDEIIDWRGVNMVPLDAFPTRVTAKKFELLTDIVKNKLNMNAIRVWGGGYFPLEEFYEKCDELGIMVWQDLPYACAVFPTSEEFLFEAFEETSELTYQLQSHPSIIIWGGNNEVEASFTWFPEVQANLEDFQQEYLQLFINTIQVAAKTIGGVEIFVDSSPTNGIYENGSKIWGDVNDPSMGDLHFYNYSMDCSDFNEYPKGNFISEHGVQSLPISLLEYITLPDPQFSEILTNRQRHENGFEQLQSQFEKIFHKNIKLTSLDYVPRSIATQILQGKCLKTAISSWRSMNKVKGILIWQLNDVWPGVSWSLLEYQDFRYKFSSFFVQEAFSNIRVYARVCPNSSSYLCLFLQSYSEFMNSLIFGHIYIELFSIKTVDYQFTMLFQVMRTQSEVEIGRIFLGKKRVEEFGVKVEGFAFTEVSDQSLVVHLRDFIELKSLGYSYNLLWKLIHVKDSCSLTLLSDVALPYVWVLCDQKLVIKDLIMLLPNQVQEIELSQEVSMCTTELCQVGCLHDFFN